MKRFYRYLFFFLLLSTLTACFPWIRVYQTYLQMDDFDAHFIISTDNQFSVRFKDPILFSEDFVILSKVQPSIVTAENTIGKRWRYHFRKIDEKGRVIQPEINFYFDLYFNEKDRLIQLDFSPLFLEIAPAAFLEISLRSLAGAKINKGKRQLKARLDQVEKILTELPQKEKVLSHLGEPIRIKDIKTKEKYRYHFQLDATVVEKGYEERGLSVIELTFDKASQRLIKMSGRFVGLKVSIDYRKYQASSKNTVMVYL